MDLRRIRRDFPITERTTYLDNAALCPVPRPVVAAITQQLQEHSEWGVARYWDWMAVVEETRRHIAALISADPDEIAFTQNTSEGVNIAAHCVSWTAGDSVVINDLEFFPNVYPWARLRAQGVDVRVVPHRDGSVALEEIARYVDGRTRVIALSHVAWVNGFRHDLAAIGGYARARGIYLVVDGIQSVGATDVDVRRGGVDFLACGGHKWLMSLPGVGFFYCRREIAERAEPPYLGWQSDASSGDYAFRTDYRPAPAARRFQHGNSNLTGIYGLHAGLTYLQHVGYANVFARNRALADRVVAGLTSLGVRFLSPLDPQHRSHIVTFLPDDVDGTVQALAAAGIAVSVRSGGIRVSPAFYNTEEEVDRLVAAVADTLPVGRRA